MATNRNDIIAASDEQQADGAQLVGGNGDDLLFADGTQSWTATLAPLNNSGVTGTVTATLSGTQLEVNVEATGLEPNQIHPMHIHGLMGDVGAPINSTVAGFDSDADGFVELAEGAEAIGEPLLNLQTATGQFPAAAADGSVSFISTFDLADINLPRGVELADLFPLDLRAVEIHGDTVTAADGVMSGGEVNGTAGYKAALPVAAAELVQTADATAATSAVLRGDNGGDDLIGGDGNDLLLGGRGNDVLAGEAGDDQLVGGSGRDVFIVGNGTDTVVDFETNLDKLTFSDGVGGAANVQANATSEGVVLTEGANTVLLVGVQPTDDLTDWIA